jgi:hypothetical protein
MDNLRISQQSIDMEDIISSLNSKRPHTVHPNDPGIEDYNFDDSPKASKGDDTFRHYDDDNLISQRASCETLTRALSPTAMEHVVGEKQPIDYIPNNGVPRQFFTQKNGYHHPQLIDEDVETFKSKLEASIVNFKNDALKDFMSIKRNVLQEQANTIDNERNKYNALLSSKQNEIENLKEALASSNKLNEDLRMRSEILALMAGKNKQMMALRVTQYKAFKALKNNVGFKKYSNNVLNAKTRENLLKSKRNVFQAWSKQWKAWKVQKSKDDFENK